MQVHLLLCVFSYLYYESCQNLEESIRAQALEYQSIRGGAATGIQINSSTCGAGLGPFVLIHALDIPSSDYGSHASLYWKSGWEAWR